MTDLTYNSQKYDGTPFILYISGPMTGIPQLNYPAFKNAEKALREHKFDILNPVDIDEINPTPGTPQSWSWYMRHAIGMVLEADGVALLDGWEQSRGAKMEVEIARALQLPIKEWQDWVDPRVITEARPVDLSLNVDGDGFKVVS